ncbi:MAG: exopolyphosphatase [Crocinitomicaceae bacterium]|nr:exopolyphosphatase [Crocinitomicaceae bacterium]
MKYGAIDIGTNAARLLIGKIVESSEGPYLNKISYTRIPLQLGKDVFEKGEISNEKIKNFVNSITAFKIIADIHECNKLRVVATSAMRESSNADLIIKKINQKTGVKIEVISGDEEARTILKAFELIEFNKEDPFIIIDVGGGSTEISIFENGNKKSSKSFKLGTLRLLNKKVKENCWDKIQDWITENIQSDHDYKIFGTGGNINKIHKILEGKQMVALEKEAIIELKNKLIPMSNLERMHQYAIKPDRADVIIPAINIFLFILEKLNANSITVPKIGLSDGIIYKLHLSDTLTTE